jgi:15-cis-phytoene synthase
LSADHLGADELPSSAPMARPVRPSLPRLVPAVPATPDARALADSYARCKALHRRHGTTYYRSTRALPRADQDHVHALYGLCRYADEILDAPNMGTTAQRSGRLEALQVRFARDLVTGHSDHPVLAAVVHTVRELQLDTELFDRFFAAMRKDLTVTRYATYAELEDYMDGSAAVIGEMMLPVLRPADPAMARPGARTLGVAFQLTNFLRDVGEDLDRGRIYLPQDEAERFGVDVAARRVDDAWRAFSRFQIARIRELYRVADTGLDHLPSRSAAVIRSARILYSEILDHIEANDHDVFRQRARVPTRRKLAVVTTELTRHAYRACHRGRRPAPNSR